AEMDILTGFQSDGFIPSDAFFSGGQYDVAAIGHGVSGVQGEVEKSQLQLIGVYLDWLESERETGLDVKRRPNGSLQKLCHPPHEFWNADHFLFEFVVARESEHALSQGRTPLCALGCIFKQRNTFGVVGQALAQHFQTTKHS